LETARAGHYTASDQLHAVQAEVYAANAEVAKVEQQIQHQRDSRNRIAQQIASLESQLAQQQAQRGQAAEQLADWREQLNTAEQTATQTAATATEQRQQLPAAQAAFDAAQTRITTCSANWPRPSKAGAWKKRTLPMRKNPWSNIARA